MSENAWKRIEEVERTKDETLKIVAFETPIRKYVNPGIINILGLVGWLDLQ